MGKTERNDAGWIPKYHHGHARRGSSLARIPEATCSRPNGGEWEIRFHVESAVVAPNRVEPDLPGPAFLDAVREQLGLKLESTKGPVQFIVIDSVEKPTEN